MLTGIEGLGDGLEVNETTGELKVGVGDGACRVVGGDKSESDIFWPLQSPEDWDIGLPAFPRLEGIAWGPSTSSALTRGIVMPFC